ncbi:MarR family winged helix-turn-helix transcriptional regulator [Paenibacillus daejeonensis]|uniref:MarR family winged helix-turn-helix transcriptional regulator n=1 Tax=Paenibacillus daejeonensis TaxID=135193 RepID=UPI0003777677|nr:MarR family transcriptional regulator [Paenibacillus daejeonensis]
MSSSQELSLKLFVVLSKVHKAMMDQAVQDMKRHGLSSTEFMILELLYHKGPSPLQQIGDKVLITSGSITYNIDKLEKKGLLRRAPSAADRRVIYAEMTDAGKLWMDDAFPLHAQALDDAMGGLSPEEKLQTIDLLKKLGQHATED